MAKTKIVKFMCSIVLAVSLVLSQSYTAMASGSSTITEQQLGVLFDGMESIVVQLEEMGLTEEEYNHRSSDELIELKREVRERMLNAGAHFVLDNITELPSCIEKINGKY